jgi:hypothetical protein
MARASIEAIDKGNFQSRAKQTIFQGNHDTRCVVVNRGENIMTSNWKSQAALFGTVALLFATPTLASTSEPVKLTFLERLFDASDVQTDMMPSAREGKSAVISTGHGMPMVHYRTYYKVPGVVAEPMSVREPVQFHLGTKGGPR